MGSQDTLSDEGHGRIGGEAAEMTNHQTTKPSNYSTTKRPNSLVAAFSRAVKRGLILLLLFSILAAAVWLWYVRERIADLHLEDTIREETSRVENKIEERGDKIDAKLDRIEGKLDRLLYLLEPRLPDGLSAAEQ